METGVPVKKETEKFNLNEFARGSKLSKREIDLGTGNYYLPILSILFWSNGLVFATRYDYLRSKFAFFISIPISFGLAKFFSLFLFGDTMYRKATILDQDSYSSALLWETKYKKNESD